MDSAYNQLLPIRDGSEVDKFVSKAASFFGWGSLREQILMDIGCGVGNTSRFLLGKFPRVYRILGIDEIRDYIDIARKEQPHGKIAYQVADIKDSNSMKRWNRLIHKAVSVFCFNYIRDVKTAYENLFNILAYEGEAAIYLTLHSGYYDFLCEMYVDPRWVQYTQEKKLLIPESHIMKLDASYHTEFLKEVGFDLVHAVTETRVHRYPSEESFKNLLILSCPNAENIPEEFQAEFSQCALETFMKYNEKDEFGIPCVKHEVVSIFVRRPWKPLYDSPLKFDTPEKFSTCSVTSSAYSNGAVLSASYSNAATSSGTFPNGGQSAFPNGGQSAFPNGGQSAFPNGGQSTFSSNSASSAQFSIYETSPAQFSNDASSATYSNDKAALEAARRRLGWN